MEEKYFRAIEAPSALDLDGESGEGEKKESAPWPRDWLGSRRAAFDSAVALVKASQPHSGEGSTDPEIDSWITDARALVSELQQRGAKSNVLPAPPTFSFVASCS
ncbi:MAG: hypothetical protein WDO06_00165 [Actinomycetota bacterium]